MCGCNNTNTSSNKQVDWRAGRPAPGARRTHRIIQIFVWLEIIVEVVVVVVAVVVVVVVVVLVLVLVVLVEILALLLRILTWFDK